MKIKDFIQKAKLRAEFLKITLKSSSLSALMRQYENSFLAYSVYPIIPQKIAKKDVKLKITKILTSKKPYGING